MKCSLLLVPLLLAALSCERADESPGAPAGDMPGQGKAFTVRLQCGTGEPPVRSSFAPADPDRISDLNVWLYRDGCLFPEYSFYTADFYGSDLQILFPDVNGVYDLYFLANAGEVEAPGREEDIGGASFTVAGYSSFVEGGFPMAGALLGYSPAEGTVLQLEKLVGRYDIRIYRNPANTKVSYTFTSGRMKACAGTVRPFACAEEGGGFSSRALSGADLLAQGDVLTAADIAALNEGETVTLYYLENCQGRLLPDNSEPRGKNAAAVAAATGDPSRAELCSYLELTCSAVTPTVTYPSVTYRAYLGRDMTGDFSVVRGTSSRLTLDVVSDRITECDWFVEPGAGTVTGRLLFTETDPFSGVNMSNAASLFESRDVAPASGTVADPSFYLQSNLKKIYYVYCNDPAMDYTVTPSAASGVSPYVTYTLEPVTRYYYKNLKLVTLTSVHWKKLTVTTGLGPGDFGGVFDSASALSSLQKAMTLDFRSYDGIIDVPVRVGVIGTLRAEFAMNSDKLLEIRLFDPIGYTLDSGMVGTEVFTAGSHYWYDAWILDYDSPFWAVYMKTSVIGGRTRDAAAMSTVFTETASASDASSGSNTVYNTMYMADNYKRRNKRSDVVDYAPADMVYARVNTLDFMLGCPPGYSFVSSDRNIPVAFGSSLDVFSGNNFFGTGTTALQGLRYSGEYPSGTKYGIWDGVYVLNGRLLDYSSTKETTKFFFEKNRAGQTYTLSMDSIYSFSSGHGSAYRSADLGRYDGLLVYGSGTHSSEWWTSFPAMKEGYKAQYD